MSRTIVKQWLSDRFNESILAETLTYPRYASEGVLYRLSLDNTKVAVFKNRPVLNIDVGQKAGIILNLLDEHEIIKSLGGPNARIENTITFQIDLLWVANFTGILSNGTPPTYTVEDVASEYFDTLIEGVRQTIRICTFKKTSSEVIENVNVSLLDPLTLQQSFITTLEPSIETFVQSPDAAENGKDVLYAASITCSFREVFNLKGT